MQARLKKVLCTHIKHSVSQNSKHITKMLTTTSFVLATKYKLRVITVCCGAKLKWRLMIKCTFRAFHSPHEEIKLQEHCSICHIQYKI